MNKPPFSGMDELFQDLLDDQIRPDEMKRLQEAMLNDPQLQDYYFDSIFASTVMRRYSQMTMELSESNLIQVLSSGQGLGSFRRFSKWLYSIAAVLIIGALICVSTGLFRNRDQGPAIGTLAGTYEAQWRGAHPRPGEPLYADSYDLQQGVAKMDLGQGTSLLLEAPCQVDLKGVHEMMLKSGRLTVSVSSQAKGFRVRTHTAVITDLGTKFGVIAHSNGSTEAHVLKGRINVALDPNKAGQLKSLDVNEEQATTVDATGQILQGGLTARGDLFLHLVPSASPPSDPSGHLNLADIVGGGNGRGTGTLDQGIDLASGRIVNQPGAKIRRTRQNAFHSSPEIPGIDGVFVPNGGPGRVVISSTGLPFSQCPETHGSYYGGPANTGKFFDLLSNQVYRVRLNGVSYGTSRHPALSLHANAGITFDLDEIRQDHPDIQFDRFTAVCGLPKDLPHPRFSSADVWVLLDGVLSHHLRFPRTGSNVEKVDVTIPAQTRFLTLVATCSGRADYSWIIFGDPFLEPAAPVQEEAGP